MLKKHFVFLFVVTFFTNSLMSQKLSEFIGSYFGNNAVPYLQPLPDLLTANMNTATNEWSAIDSSLYIRLSIHAIYSFPSEKMKTFQGETGNSFEPAQIVTVPTIVGKNDAVSVDGLNGTVYIFPVGYNVKRVPMGIPQLTIGGFFNSELTARFFTFSFDNDLGDLQFIGIGGRHNISHYFKNFPIDLSLGYFYHHVSTGDYVKSSHHLISVCAGKSGKLWSSQLMLGYQTTSMKANYTFDDGSGPEEVNLNLTNDNPFIAELSLGFKFSIIGIHASASYADLLSASLGLGLYF